MVTTGRSKGLGKGVRKVRKKGFSPRLISELRGTGKREKSDHLGRGGKKGRCAGDSKAWRCKIKVMIKSGGRGGPGRVKPKGTNAEGGWDPGGAVRRVKPETVS